MDSKKAFLQGTVGIIHMTYYEFHRKLIRSLYEFHGDFGRSILFELPEFYFT